MEVDSTLPDYFSSYGDLDVHKLMLEDEPRTLAYKKAILGNKGYFQDKLVMDVGCGTGILSIFCAQAGAKKVYAVEASNTALLAKDIARENYFDHVIEVIHSKVEDLDEQDCPKVDVIVSEWMGFYLLHESMLDSVLVARDKFLKADGHMFPESAALYVAPCSVPQLYHKWEEIYGVHMQTFGRQLRTYKGNKPEIMTMTEEQMLGTEVIVCWLDLKQTTLEDLESFTIQHVVGATRFGRYQGLCIWFECIFPDLTGGNGENRVILDTSPKGQPTHWKQTVIVFPEEFDVEVDEPIAFELDITRDLTNNRSYNLGMTYLEPEAIDHPQPCSCHMTKCILVKTLLEQHTDHVMNQNNEDSVMNQNNEDGVMNQNNEDGESTRAKSAHILQHIPILDDDDDDEDDNEDDDNVSGIVIDRIDDDS